MSRYIDADALEDKAKWYSLGYYEEDEWAVPFNETYDVPSIDIVRCAECKYWDRDRAKRNKIQFKGYCDMHSGYCDGDKYCAWGERREP